MDFNSRRITAIIENALLEDRATRDATSYACIDPNQRASATILAKEDCILAGIGCVGRILDVYAALFRFREQRFESRRFLIAPDPQFAYAEIIEDTVQAIQVIVMRVREGDDVDLLKSPRP